MKKLNIIVTAGGVTERIDSVRKITNSSSGKLGIMIAGKLAEKYPQSKITIIGSRQAFRDNVIPALPNGSQTITIESTADLEREVKLALVSEHVDIFVHSMAVADYTTDKVIDFDKFTELIEAGSNVNDAMLAAAVDTSSKMPSSLNMMIKMKQTPKIIKMVKELSPRTFLVGFKLLNNVMEAKLFNVGFNLLRENRCNLVVANDLANIRKGNHRAMIIFPEKSYDVFEGKETIASGLVELIDKRAFVGHPASKYINRNNCVGSHNDEINNAFLAMSAVGERLFKAGLLPEVINHDRPDAIGTYGNISVSLGHGQMLITSRNVHKGHLTQDDVSLITTVEEKSTEPNVYAEVFYRSPMKPSIDTAIHAKIYELTRAKAIIHIHTDKIFLGYPYVNEQFPCGSMEERDAIIKAMKRGRKHIAEFGAINIVQMKKHGLIIAGESLAACETALMELFDLTPYINSKSRCDDAEILNHISDVKAKFTHEKGHIYNLELHEEVIGCVWEEHEKYGQCVNFGLFTKANCRKGLHIVEKYLKLYDVQYMLHTTEGCNIADFYRDKYGFVDLYQEDNHMILYQPRV